MAPLVSAGQSVLGSNCVVRGPSHVIASYSEVVSGPYGVIHNPIVGVYKNPNAGIYKINAGGILRMPALRDGKEWSLTASAKTEALKPSSSTGKLAAAREASSVAPSCTPYSPAPKSGASSVAAAAAAPAAVAAPTPEPPAKPKKKEKRKDITLLPGPLGLNCDWTNGKILGVLDGQCENRVEVGWQFLTVDGQAFSERLIDAKIAGGKPYRVVFGDKLSSADASPEGWTTHVNDEGVTYYYNAAKKEVKYELPIKAEASRDESRKATTSSAHSSHSSAGRADETREASPPDVTDNNGAAPTQISSGGQARKAWSWIRFDNSEPCRAARRGITQQTQQASKAMGYYKNGEFMPLINVENMLAGTKRVAPSLGNVPSGVRSLPPHSFGSTEITQNADSKVCLQVALELGKKYYSFTVAAVSAASAYHCGGGFLSGGRHALEEAICIQTTVFESLQAEEKKALESFNFSGKTQNVSYIPMDGVVLSPKVEIFRGGSDHGYPFSDEPITLAAVISLAMFNRNTKLSDAPVDAPASAAEYAEGVRTKFRSVLSAAMDVGCTALVMPDAGCGVYENDPEQVGALFGEVLAKEFWGCFEEVALVGKPEFQKAVAEAAAAAVKCRERPQQESLRLYAQSLGSLSHSPPPAEDARGRSSPSPSPSFEPARRQSPPPETCASCSAALRPGAKFCSGCGEASAGSAPPSRTAPPPHRNSKPPTSRSSGRGRQDQRDDGRHHSDEPRRGNLHLPKQDHGGRSRSPSPSPDGGMCRFRCGNPVKPGVTPNGKPYNTCCKSCAMSKGGGRHDSDCPGSKLSDSEFDSEEGEYD